MAKRRSIGVLATCAALSACSTFNSRPDEVILPEGKARAPLRIVKGLPLVQASIGGSEPYWFLVDTGATGAFISKRLVDAHSLPTVESSLLAIDAHGARQPIPQVARVPSLKVGSFEMRGFDALLLDFSRLQEAVGLPLEGILGFTNFFDCLMTLDYANGEVLFEKGELPEPDGDSILPIQILNGMPHIQVRVGQANVLLRVDSGSGYAFTFTPDTEQLNYKQDPVPGPLSLSLTGLARVKLTRLKFPIDIGGHHFAEPAVTLTSGAAKIGGRGLMHFRVTFDQKHERVRLSSESHDGIRTSHRWTAGGLGVQRTMSGPWVVVDVIPGSDAERAGVHCHDRIKSVDGRPVEDLDYGQFGDFPEDQKELTLELIRGGKSYRVTLPILDPIP